MRFTPTLTLAVVIGLSGPAVAQQSSGADAQKSPSVQTGTNAETNVSAPAGTERDARKTPDSDKQKAPSPVSGTNADQSKDPSRDPIKSK
jgi:hypothetical protein